MAGRPIKTLEISDTDRQQLQRWLRRRKMPAAEQTRARIILLSSEGLSGKQIGKRTGVTAQMTTPNLSPKESPQIR